MYEVRVIGCFIPQMIDRLLQGTQWYNTRRIAFPKNEPLRHLSFFSELCLLKSLFLYVAPDVSLLCRVKRFLKGDGRFGI